MMLTLYVVFALLALELIVLALLLMPYVNRVTSPIVEKLLIVCRLPLRITLGVLSFLFYEAFTEMMKHQESASDKVEMLARMETLKLKFRAERNFYLFAFTFTVFIIILRLDVILCNYRLSKARVEELELRVNGAVKTPTSPKAVPDLLVPQSKKQD